MSSSDAERFNRSTSANAAGPDPKAARRWPLFANKRFALALATASLPLGAFAYISSNWPLLGVSAAAVFTAISVATRAHMQEKPTRRTDMEGRDDAFSHLVEHVRDAVLQFDAAGQLTLASQSSEKLFGCPKYELSGAGIAERTHVLDRPLYLTAFSDAQVNGKDRLIEIRMRRDHDQSGQVAPDFVWMELNLSPIKTKAAADGPYEVVVLLRDISSRKESESRMLEAHKAAEEASLAKSQFLAVIGHELRTPLNAIVGFSDMMSSGIGGTLEPTHAEYASLISQSGHHLLEVVNMLLDMSKIEAGRFEIQTEIFEPEGLISPCIQMVSKTAQEKNVEIEVKLGKHLPEIVGDERACRQILINLLSNAIKFSEPGNCVTWAMKRQGQYLSMTVSDTGIGMSADVVARLGEPFFQAQSSADRRYEGTGLGISIVKGLVDLHDGILNVTSDLGQGTKVNVLLPISGPKVKTHDDNHVTQLHSATDEQSSEQWSEPKRMAQ